MLARTVYFYYSSDENNGDGKMIKGINDNDDYENDDDDNDGIGNDDNDNDDNDNDDNDGDDDADDTIAVEQ